MKTNIVLFLSIIWVINLHSQNKTTIQFDLANKPDTIFLHDKKETKNFVLKSEKIINFKITTPKYVAITNSGYRVIYLEPNFNIKIKGNSIKDSIWFEGKGARENNYLTKKSSILNRLNKDLNFFELKSMDKDKFYNKILSYENQLINNLKKIKFKSSAFQKLELNSIKFIIAKRVKSFQGKKPKISKEDKIKYPIHILFPFEKINLDNENALAIDNFAYAEYLQKHFEIELSKTYDNSKGLDYNQQIQILAGQKIINQKILDDFLFYYTYSLLKYLPNKQVYFETFKDLCKNKDYIKTITELYNSFSSVKKGMLSPNFSFIDLENKIHTLNDFKGKYTYIDIWATWCKPCIADYPKMEKLFETYGKKINIVSIAYLDTKNNWKNFLNQNNPKWKQLFSDNNNQDFFKKYNITGVPRYILLDKNGKILFSNAPPPSNISKVLDSLLN